MPKRVKNETVQNDRRAFTLIGLLSSVVLASLNTARQKAEEARHISDINSVETALMLYYDAQGHYPPGSDGVAFGDAACDGGRAGTSFSMHNLSSTAQYCLVPKYLAGIPNTYQEVPDFYFPDVASPVSRPDTAYLIAVYDPNVTGWCVVGPIHTVSHYMYSTLFNGYPPCPY